MSLRTQINGGETEILEFKETFRYDVKTNINNKALKREVSKAVCGMLNSKGGIVLIGVADDKTIKGIQRDIKLFGKGDESTQLDKLLIELYKHLTDAISINSKKYLNINVDEIDGKKIILIEVKSSIDPFFHFGDTFFVRDGPRTISLLGKKMMDYISERKKSLNVRSHEEMFQEKLEVIIPMFKDWSQEKLKQNLSLKVNKNSLDGKIYDYIFGCIVPNTISEDLIDFKSNVIEEYNNNYSIIKDSQNYKTPEFASQNEESLGEEIRIYPGGKIYFCQMYWAFNKENPKFSLGRLESSSYERLIVKKYQEKYSAPFSHINWGSLNSLLEVICFLFHPQCKIKMVNSPTELFHLEIIVPNMIYEGKRRVFSHSYSTFPTHKSYLGTNKDITYSKLFRFEEIDSTVEDLKRHIIEFYQNPRSKAYSRF